MITINADILFPSLALYYNGASRKYELHAVTYTPNSCYSAGNASTGVPNGYATLPEVLPVTLDVLTTGGPFCLMFIKPVFHMLEFTAEQLQGHTALTAYATVGGNVVGINSIEIGGFDLMPAATPAGVGTERHHAYKLLAYDGNNPWRTAPNAYDGDNPWRVDPKTTNDR